MRHLDFNAIEQPTMLITLKDPDKTEVHLSAPDVDLMDRLEAMTPELNSMAKDKNVNAIRRAFDVVAELMNFNEDGFTFTGEELRGKYRMNFYDLLQFVAAYFEFIKEIKDAKN